MNTADIFSTEQKREIGKAYFFNHDADNDKKNYGLKLIIDAHSEKDPEATYIVARLLLDGVLKSSSSDQQEYALTLMCSSANSGCIQARAFLNAYCEERYQEEHDDIQVAEPNGALVDFDGKPIKINRQGLFTPIDAVLENEGGSNILTLSANIMFLYGEEIANPEKFEQSVYDGILAWQGEYEVFGGQKIKIRIHLTNDDNVFDNLLIMPITGEIGATIQSVSNAIGTKKSKLQVSDVMMNKRSFATSGLRWTVNSRKIICLQSRDGRFDDYEEIMHVTKHEFGHALGLGDLYASAVDSLSGVEKGTYAELDSYVINDKFYNLVMCDHHGPISNNDIEMVVLAFRENKMQLFQPSRLKGKISSALGKGN